MNDFPSSEPASVSPQTFRLGSVPYLNAAPLTWRLEEIAAENQVTFLRENAIPSLLAKKLVAGEYDVALIPVAEALRHSELVQVSDVCIASEGAVGSVKLLSRQPLGQIQTIALDEASRSSAAMTLIYLHERIKNFPQAVPLKWSELLPEASENIDFSDSHFLRALGESLAAREIDAILLIGDVALKIPHQVPSFPYQIDMGQAWTQWIGLPFVYASWFTRRDVDGERLSWIFNEARRASQVEMDILILHEAMKNHLPLDLCYDYLNFKIRYRLGGRERRGVEVFGKMAQKYGLIPLGAGLEFEANRKRFAHNSSQGS
ncbi:MAG: menaquinone biosynthesis protein [Planctomycetia bacterium]|nr:menaquinone biosynthesis protein [Planctomycetia bacterium]